MSDPVCAFHGLKWSDHQDGRCYYCALCFITLTADTCYLAPDGVRYDVCEVCGPKELLNGTT